MDKVLVVTMPNGVKIDVTARFTPLTDHKMTGEQARKLIGDLLRASPSVGSVREESRRG